MTKLKPLLQYMLPVLVTAALTWYAKDGCAQPASPPASSAALPASAAPATVVRDSVDLDSVKATITPRLRIITVHDAAAGAPSDSAAQADSARRSQRALSEALAYIDTLLAALGRSPDLGDITAARDTVLTDLEKGSVYRVHQEYSYARMEFSLGLIHEYIARESTFWSELSTYGPYVAAATAVLKIVYDSLHH